MSDTSVAAIQRMPRLVGLQYLRAAAALAVVAYHACARLGLNFGPGAAGVDVFFVISGFVMWTTTAGRATSPAQFAWQRLARIVPLYWCATLAIGVAWCAFPGLFAHLRLDRHSVLASLAFVPYRNGAGEIYPLLVSGWTLNYEMFFYALFAATLCLHVRLRLAAIIGGLAALICGGLLTHPAGAVGLTYTDPLLAEFGAGMVLGVLWRGGHIPSAGAGAVLLIAALCAYAALAVAGMDIRPWRVLLWGVPALATVTATLAIERAGLMPRWHLLGRLGDASYSIYLLHTLLISALLRLLGGHPVLLIAGSLAGAGALGLLSHAGLERPIARALRRAPPRRAAHSAAVLAVAP